MPAGYITDNEASYLVKVGEKVESQKDIENLVICDMGFDDLDPIRLSDVADIAITDNSKDVYTMVNGNPAVALTMEKATGYSTGDVTKRLESRLDQLEKDNEGLHTTVLMNQGLYIDLVVDSVVDNLLYGALFSIIILLLFLKDLRPDIYRRLLHPTQCCGSSCIDVFQRCDLECNFFVGTCTRRRNVSG